MKNYRVLILLSTLLVFSLAFVAGCDDDDDPTTTIIEAKPFVSGVVSLGEGGPRKGEDSVGMAMISVTNFSTIPGVQVNEMELGVEPEFSIYGGGLGFVGTFEIEDDYLANMVVHFGEGNDTGNASVSMPGVNYVVGDEDVLMVPYNGFEAVWTSAPRANVYMVSGYFEVQYTDTNEVNQYYDYSFSFTTTDTSVTFTPAMVWPPEAEVLSVNNMWGDLDVVSVSGPVTPGDAGNVTGACNGVLASYGRMLDWDFDDVPPMKGSADEGREITPDWPVLIMQMIQANR